MPWVSVGFGVASSVIGAMGQEDAASARATQIAQQETNSEWQLQNQNNNLAVNEYLPVGIGQQRAQAWNLKTNALLSTITAVAAANSGGGSRDPGIVNLMAKIQAQGNANAQTEVANGLMKAHATQAQIDANNWSIRNGAAAAAPAIDNTLSAGDTAAFGTLLSGAGDMYSKYGKDLFNG